MAVYGYVRVSTEQQSQEGVSLNAQQRQLEGYAMQHDMEINEMYIEGAVSGWKPLDTRPAGSRMLSGLDRGDVVLCPKLDRMFRNSNDALAVSERLKKLGVSLHLLDLGGDVTGNGVSKVFFTILAAFAEFERDRIAQRVKDVKHSQREDGKFLGGSLPFGYSLSPDGLLEPNTEGLRVVDEIAAMRQEGKSLRAISSALKQRGVILSHVTVRRLLKDRAT